MKRNNATNRIRVATESPSPEGVERALQCTTDNPSTPSAATIADQPHQEHARQASAIDGSKVATTSSTSATDRCCSDSTNNVVDLQNESSPYTPYTKRKIPGAAASSNPTDHLSQAKISSPMYMYLYDDVSDAGDECEEERRQRFAAKRRRHEGKITFPSYYEDLLAEVTGELAEANAEAVNIGERRRQEDGDERRQTLLGLPSFMTTSRNDERHPLAFAAELIAGMDVDNDDVDDDDDGDKRIM
jgi:hypothetical protein